MIIPNIWKHKFHVPNHQPVDVYSYNFPCVVLLYWQSNYLPVKYKPWTGQEVASSSQETKTWQFNWLNRHKSDQKHGSKSPYFSW